MSFKFSLNQLVELENGAVGKVIERKETLSYIEEYSVSFIDYEEEYDVDALKKTSKTVVTTQDGKTQEQLDEEKRIEKEKQEKRNKADNLVSAIKDARNRYVGKCKDGNAFWQFFNEDVEKLIYKELGAEKDTTLKTYNELFSSIYGGFPCYTGFSGKNK